MKDHVYIACDLNNAEKKEMPIQLRSAQNKRTFSQSIGILF